MTRLVPLSEFLASTHLPAEIVQLWEGSFHFVETGVNFRLEHQCECRAEEPQMSKSENAKSYTERAASEPTELHKNFAQWIYEQTGVRPDLKSVQLACSLRMDFQASETNQKSLKARKQAAADKAAKAKAAKIAKAKATLAKLQAEIAAEEAAVSTPAETTAPAKKATPAKPEDKPAMTPRSPRKATAAKASEKAPTQPRAARTRRTATATKTDAPVVTAAK